MIQKIVGALHSKLVFNRRIQAIANSFKNQLMPGLVLDVGCGNGMISQLLMGWRDDVFIMGVDTLLRPKTFIPTLQYNGINLPFKDNTFSTVLLVDVLHHTHDPQSVLKECARVCRGNILIKDHFSETRLDLILLKLLDWVGNRPHGVQLPYNYFSRKQWENILIAINIREKDRAENVQGLYPLFFQEIIGKRIQFTSNLSKNIIHQ